MVNLPKAGGRQDYPGDMVHYSSLDLRMEQCCSTISLTAFAMLHPAWVGHDIISIHITRGLQLNLKGDQTTLKKDIVPFQQDCPKFVKSLCVRLFLFLGSDSNFPAHVFANKKMHMYIDQI